jgi:glutamate/aspartate transport system permease protein
VENSFDWDVVTRNLGFVLIDGLGFTLMLTVTATIGGIILGIVLALMRQSRYFWISKPAELYIDAARALPLILVIFWVFFLLPWIAQWITGASRPVAVGAYTSAFVTFTLFEAAYFAEIVRSGIRGIRQTQVDAGYSLGMTYPQVMGSIVLPQALRNMLPVLATQTIVLFQDSSLVYVISLTDLLGAASKVAQRDGRLVEMYVFAAVVYFVISFTASQFVHHLQKRLGTSRL